MSLINSKKHIIITSLDMFLMGGVERTNASLSKLFISQGHKVTLISLFKNSDEPFFDFEGNKIITMCNSPHGLKHSILIKIKTILAFFKLLNYLNKFEDDYILISSYPRTSILFGIFFSDSRKVIAHEHSTFSTHGSFVSKLRLLTYKSLKCVVTLTNHDNNIFKKNDLNSYKIPNFSDFRLDPVFKKIDENRTLNCLSAGRLHPHKGFDRLIKIANKLKNEDIKFTIVGSGDEEKNIRSLIKKYNLQHSVLLKPASPNLHEHMKDCDIFLLTSTTEAAPLVILEAFSYSKPVVAYDCPIGPREIVNNEVNGFLIEDDDIETYIIRIKEILNSNEKYNYLSKGAALYAKSHSAEQNYKLWQGQL